MTAAVEHRETGIGMRSSNPDLSRFMIQAGLLHETGPETLYGTGHATVWCNTMEAVAAVEGLVDAFGLTAELDGSMRTTTKDRMTVRIDVRP